MPATLLSDLFTDADGTALTAHAMTAGGGWTAAVGTFQVTGNKAVPTSSANDDMAVAEAGTADVILTCDVVTQNLGVAWESDPDLLLRYIDPTHCWLVHVTSNSGTLQLVERNGAGDNVVASSIPGFVAGGSYAIRVVAQGPVITLSVNGVQQFVYAAATANATGTMCGLRYGTAGGVTTPCSWDNFLVIAAADVAPMPEVRYGPNALRAPFVRRRRSEAGWLVGAAPAAAVVGPQLLTPEVRRGPNALRAPFVRRRAAEAGWLITAQTASTATAAKPALFRVPGGDERRLARFSEVLSSIVNSLMGQGVLIQTGPDSWAVAARSAGGVITFDGRTGTITLQAADINAAFAAAGIHEVYAGPGPKFRPLTTADLPSGVGSVTSVDILGPDIIQWSGRPVTAAGQIQGQLANQLANAFLAGPASGAVGVPAFRVLTPADITASGAVAALRSALGFSEHVHVYRSTAQTCTQAIANTVLFNVEYLDSHGFHSTVTNTDRLVVPAGLDGVYIVCAAVRWASNSTGGRQIKIMGAGGPSSTLFRPFSVQSVVPITGAQTDQIAFSPPVRLVAGNSVGLQCVQSSGGDLDIEYGADFAPNLGMWRIST